MVKIYHEAPNDIFKSVKVYTDGDYALVHLLEQDEEYMKLFSDSAKEGREIILDNSLYELGAAFDPSAFADWVDKLGPSWYIVPDTLNDRENTEAQFIDWWEQHYFKLKNTRRESKAVPVLQGKTYDEIAELLSIYMMNDVEMVAIPFGLSMYNNQVGMSHEVRSMKGRIELVQRLHEDFHPHVYGLKFHLLGTWLPQEGMAYRNHPAIYSVDSSNPIIHGLERIRYTEVGLERKSKNKLHNLISVPTTSAQWNDIEYNMGLFRGYWN